MRPPEHWHLAPRRRSNALWWWLFALTAAVVGGALLLRWQLAGGEPRPSTTSAAACTAGVDCPSSGDLIAVAATPPPPPITGRAAALIEAPCGAVLYEKNARQRLAPASLTKMATALVAVERARLDEEVDVRVNSALLAASSGSTVMGLQPGQRLRMRDLLYGLLLPSGNDAAIAVAEHVGGSVPAFVELMNAKAEELGLEDTHFANPHGLDEPGLYTSARDMALLGQALLEEPELAAIVREKSYQPAWDGPPVWNGNELLTLYPEAIGVKIGYTEGAGQTIAAAAERDGRRVIVSVLGAWDRYSDAINLFEWAFANAEPACDGS